MSRKDDDWARYEGKIRVEKPASPSPATRLVKTKPSKKSSKPTPKYTVREDGTLAPYKAEVVNTLTQCERDDRLVPSPVASGDVPALKLRLSSSGYLIQIPSPKKEKEIIELMSSDAESDAMPPSSGGAIYSDSENTVPSSCPHPIYGVCRPDESNGDVGPGDGYPVSSVTYGAVGRDPPGLGAAARNTDSALAHGVVRGYLG